MPTAFYRHFDSDRGARAGAGRGVVRVAARDAARRTTSDPTLPEHHRQLGAGARASTCAASTSHFAFIARERVGRSARRARRDPARRSSSFERELATDLARLTDPDALVDRGPAGALQPDRHLDGRRPPRRSSSSARPGREPAILARARTQLRMLLVGALHWRSRERRRQIPDRDRPSAAGVDAASTVARRGLRPVVLAGAGSRPGSRTPAPARRRRARRRRRTPTACRRAGRAPGRHRRATSAVARDDMTVTTSAVPMAPATCWSVPSSELPWEYRCGGSAPSPSVNTGVKTAARLTISSTWATRTSQVGVVSADLGRAAASATTMPTAPGMTSTPAAEAVEDPADARAEQPHRQAAGHHQQAGLQGAQAAHVLEVERQQDHRAEHRHERDRHQQQRDRVGADA